jgi:hypothetical protein
MFTSVNICSAQDDKTFKEILDSAAGYPFGLTMAAWLTA